MDVRGAAHWLRQPGSGAARGRHHDTAGRGPLAAQEGAIGTGKTTLAGGCSPHVEGEKRGCTTTDDEDSTNSRLAGTHTGRLLRTCVRYGRYYCWRVHTTCTYYYSSLPPPSARIHVPCSCPCPWHTPTLTTTHARYLSRRQTVHA